MARRLQKAQREALRVIEDELASHGVTEFTVVQKRKHLLVRWGRHTVGVSGTPSDCMALTALRANVRKLCKGTAG